MNQTSNPYKNGKLKEIIGYRWKVFLLCGIPEFLAVIALCTSIFYMLKELKLIKLKDIDAIQMILLPAVGFLFVWALYAFILYPREIKSNMLMTGYLSSDAILMQVVLSKLIESNLVTENEIGGPGKTDLEKIENKFIELLFNKDSKLECKSNYIPKHTHLEDQTNNIIKQNIIPFLTYLSKHDFFTTKYTNSSKLYKLMYDGIKKCTDKNGKINAAKVQENFNIGGILDLQKSLFSDKKEYKAWFKIKFSTENHRVRKAYEVATGGLGNNLLTGGQMLKYAAKCTRYVIAGVFVGSIALFLNKISKNIEKEENLFKTAFNGAEHIKDLITICSPYIISFVLASLFFFFMTEIGSVKRVINKTCMEHTQQVFVNLFSDLDLIMQLKERPMHQLDTIAPIDQQNKADESQPRSPAFAMVLTAIPIAKPQEESFVNRIKEKFGFYPTQGMVY